MLLFKHIVLLWNIILIFIHMPPFGKSAAGADLRSAQRPLTSSNVKCTAREQPVRGARVWCDWGISQLIIWTNAGVLSVSVGPHTASNVAKTLCWTSRTQTYLQSHNALDGACSKCIICIFKKTLDFGFNLTRSCLLSTQLTLHWQWFRRWLGTKQTTIR